ncbi:hypothetical protein BMW23_0285 [Bodo saltans virus]|jgi:hypothetical protein|uniref:Uncharacterized protein n=1 Tax=Bodo saltans virus TaxID=2024608 RepID=A0A2H4UTS0_9VIRU|nr:hypothetical protein QJ851_gp0280 [Bodo saltans virus]ATZ80343.1 hypothetical protein BMW23_0285 [Bodo saltans virus]
MSKIAKYKENMYNFLTTKSCFNNFLDKDIIRDFIETDFALFYVAMGTIFSMQVKKNKIKSFHIMHISSAIFLMLLIVAINENTKYYEKKYGEKNIRNILNQATIFILESVMQNIKTMENALGSDNSNKMGQKINSFIHEKLLLLTECTIIDKKLKMKKTEITHYKFNEPSNLDKYKKLSRIENADIKKYIDDKYGTIGQCVVILSWLFGMNDNKKSFDSLLKVGSSLGTIIKLIRDFDNLENDIENTDRLCYNYVVNCGIHECFSFYDDNKLKFIEGAMTNNLYNDTMMEITQCLEKKLENCLKKIPGLELESQYSSSKK